MSRYPESGEEKLSLGPVFAVNPRYVWAIDVVITDHKSLDNWLVVKMVAGMELTTELESGDFCEGLLAQFVARNAEILVTRLPILASAK